MGKLADSKSVRVALKRSAAMKKRASATKIPPALDPLALENSALRERNADLVGQIERLSQSRMIGVSEESDMTRIRVEHAAMRTEQNELALYFREHFREEIDRGDHQGMTLSKIVQMYLSRVKRGGVQ
jgi:hypothetical protein